MSCDVPQFVGQAFCIITVELWFTVNLLQDWVSLYVHCCSYSTVLLVECRAGGGASMHTHTTVLCGSAAWHWLGCVTAQHAQYACAFGEALVLASLTQTPVLSGLECNC